MSKAVSQIHGTTRRKFTGIALSSIAALGATDVFAQATATPTGEWSYSDVFGNTVTLPKPPERIAANIVTAAALWDLGIKCVAVFDWTSANYPDGDHIAWGNIDVSEIVQVADVEGNIIPEELILAEPDIILTQTFDKNDPSQTLGVSPKLADSIATIAPVLVVTDMEPADVQVERLVALGESLGANLDDPAIVEAKAAYDAKIEEFRSVATEKSDLTTLFFNAGPEELYIGGPEGVMDLKFLASLGLKYANADTEAVGDFWESLSSEQALLYPADVLFMDIYSTLLTADDLAAAPTYAEMPAVKANQVGVWERDYPQSYEGVTNFLEKLLETLRTAEKVT